MSDNQFFSNQNLQSQDETLEVIERGYTLKRKIAIWLWFTALILLTAMTYRCFALHDAGIDWFLKVDIALMSNTEFGTTSGRFFIPIFECLRYAGFGLSVVAGIKTLIALFIPPPKRIHAVRITMMRAGTAKDL